MNKTSFHGSDIEKIEEVYGVPKEEIVSFAANVNPLGMSPGFVNHAIKNLESFRTYPDREYTELRTSIAKYCKVDMSMVVVGSGATELISASVNTINPQNVLVLEPTYSEYVRRLELLGANISAYELKQENDFEFDLEEFLSLVPGQDLIMICNPNNPTGNAITTDTIDSICAAATKNDCRVLIDETYVEFTQNIDSISAVSLATKHSNLIILRGTSKFFDTPGLRLGYMICGSKEFLAECKKGMDPWSVNSLAAKSAGEMFSDIGFIKFSRRFIKIEMCRILDEISKLPIHVYPPVANILLIRLPDGITSNQAFEYFIKRGLMIRDCSTFKGLGDRHIRICISTEENNNRFLNALKDLCQSL